MASGSRYVIARECNVVRVDFRRAPDPPAPQFPGAGALRTSPHRHPPIEASASPVEARAA